MIEENENNLYRFLSLFCLSEDNRRDLLEHIINSDNFEENYLNELLYEFKNKIEQHSFFNIFINSLFGESGQGKSYLALFLIEKMLAIYPDFNFKLLSSLDEFLHSKIIPKTIYLIDDTTKSNIGLGSKRVKQQFLDFFNISARFNQVCLVFTTTYDIESFHSFSKNIHKFISVIGYNPILKKSCSYVYPKNLNPYYIKMLIGDIPTEEILEEYLDIKQKYASQFLDIETHLSSVKKLAGILFIKEKEKVLSMSKKALLTFITLKYEKLSKDERVYMCELIDLVRTEKVSLKDLGFNEEEIQKNIT